MSYTIPTQSNGGFYEVDVVGVASTTGGGVASVPNPEGVDLAILRTFWLIDTASTGSANINIGVGAATTTDASDIISALAANGSVEGLYNGIAQVVTAKSAAGLAWPSGSYLNITGSGSTVGLAARLFVEYIRVP